VQAAPKAARPPSRRQRANPQYSLPVVYRSKVGGFEDAYRAANPLPPPAHLAKFGNSWPRPSHSCQRFFVPRVFAVWLVARSHSARPAVGASAASQSRHTASAPHTPVAHPPLRPRHPSTGPSPLGPPSSPPADRSNLTLTLTLTLTGGGVRRAAAELPAQAQGAVSHSVGVRVRREDAPSMQAGRGQGDASGHGGRRRRYVRAQRAQGKGRDEGDADREGAVRDSEREEQEAQSALALRARARNAGGGWRRQRVGGGGARRATAEQPVRNA
jgi:hypothetical protein